VIMIIPDGRDVRTSNQRLLILALLVILLVKLKLISFKKDINEA
jgi:hypothetical protein